MNIYQISLKDKNPYDNYSKLVFAKTELRAKRLYWKFRQEWHYYENEDMITLKQVSHEASIKIFKTCGDLPKCGGILNENSKNLKPIFREMGWGYEHESSCDTCGLYPFEMEEHWIDEDGQCDECR
ncbi:hypothetical protein [Leptospira alexanderi]|uniref:hypothetical protein n=1 Tax=Leptospira alexanderi TaxID=100053 RepID=UPI000990EA9B|nr:hypothetical protein [Leptospira alexanderi]